jgi:hypothetical protein
MLSICSLAEEAVRVIHWQKMMGIKHPELQVYVDPATVRQEDDNGIRYGYAAVLFHRQYPVDIKVDGKPYTATSVIRYYIASCDKHMLASVVDYYFNLNRLPVISDQPLLTIDHSSEKKAAQEVSKENPIFKTLCPEYI